MTKQAERLVMPGRLPRLARRPAAAGRTSPGLARGEWVLARESDTRTGVRLVATRDAVYVENLSGGLASWWRLGWERVERVEWDAARGELRLVSLIPEAVPDVAVRLATPGRLPQLAQERMTATTPVRVPLRHAGRLAGWITARRPVAGDGEVAWVVRLAAGVTLTDAEVGDAIRRVRAETGL
jgi:hypothetical protein